MPSQPQMLAVRRHDLRGAVILVVEDHVDSLDLLVTVLESVGAKVFSATTAREAFELLQLHRPDVVVSDVGLPDEDGHSLVKRIRQLSAAQGGGTPAIALTAYAALDGRRAALAAGFQHFLNKPVDIARLFDAVERCLPRPGSAVRPPRPAEDGEAGPG